jgi:hypothetical protein
MVANALNRKVRCFLVFAFHCLPSIALQRSPSASASSASFMDEDEVVASSFENSSTSRVSPPFSSANSAAARALGSNPTGSFRIRNNNETDSLLPTTTTTTTTTGGGGGRVIRVGENEDGALIIDSNSSSDISLFATGGGGGQRKRATNNNNNNQYNIGSSNGGGGNSSNGRNPSINGNATSRSSAYESGFNHHYQHSNVRYQTSLRSWCCNSDSDYCYETVEKRYLYCTYMVLVVLVLLAILAFALALVYQVKWVKNNDDSLNNSIITWQQQTTSLQNRVGQLEYQVGRLQTQVATLTQELQELANATLPHDQGLH